MKKTLSLILTTIMLASVLVGCGGSGSKENTVTVSSKQYTENLILGEMYAQLIEAKTDLTVERKLNLGGTSVIMPAMTEGEVDLYFEYSGTICSEILKADTIKMDAETALSTAQSGMNSDHDMTFFEPVGLNNTYAVGIPAALQADLGITKISELKEYAPDLVFASGHTFRTRVSDGYDALLELYGLEFKGSEIMDSTLMYEASATGAVDVVVAFATDALLMKYDIVLLEDDLGLFPPYHGAPLCRNEVLTAYPELEEVLNLLSGKIDDTTMQGLNYQCDVENKDIAEIATNFLTEQGLI